MFAVLHKELTMNERIRELAEQATGAEEYDGFRYFDKAKFAELIVRECAQVCLSQRDPANLNYKPSERFAEAVKQHFGVKE
jgi:menaquinone-dependent protoporphyrinogen IX oxidase